MCNIECLINVFCRVVLGKIGQEGFCKRSLAGDGVSYVRIEGGELGGLGQNMTDTQYILCMLTMSLHGNLRIVLVY